MKYHITQLRRLFTMRPHTKAPFIYPAREWALGLLVGVFVFVIGVVHGSALFMSASNKTEADVLAPQEVVEIPYNEREVRAVLATYEARARAFAQMRGALPVATSTPVTEASVPEEPQTPSGVTPVAE